MVSFFTKDISNNDISVKQSNFKPILFGIITVIILFSVIFLGILKSGESLSLYMARLLQASMMLLVLGGLLSFVVFLMLSVPSSIMLATYLFNISIVVLVLALVSKIFKINANAGSSSSFAQLIIAVIFYIPCLFITLVESIKLEYNISTRTEWIVLMVEVLVVGLRVAVPYIYSAAFDVKGDMIEAGPIYLNKEHSFGIIRNKDIPKSDPLKTKPDNYNYAISTWIWINPQPPSTSNAYNESASLLNYGDMAQINFVKDNIEIWASTSEKTDDSLVKIYATRDFRYQKWNNIVLNYSGGTLDVFINNDLVASKMNITPIMYNNKITTGRNNGIHGGIKDIVYYDKVLTRNEVSSIFFTKKDNKKVWQ